MSLGWETARQIGGNLAPDQQIPVSTSIRIRTCTSQCLCFYVTTRTHKHTIQLPIAKNVTDCNAPFARDVVTNMCISQPEKAFLCQAYHASNISLLAAGTSLAEPRSAFDRTPFEVSSLAQQSSQQAPPSTATNEGAEEKAHSARGVGSHYEFMGRSHGRVHVDHKASTAAHAHYDPAGFSSKFHCSCTHFFLSKLLTQPVIASAGVCPN